MGGPGSFLEQGNDVELAPGCLPGLALPCGRPPQAGTSETGISAYRRDPCVGAEGTRAEEHFGFLYVGILQHQGLQTAGPVF